MIERSRSLRSLAAMVGAAILCAAPLRAQDASTATVPNAPVPSTMEAAPVPSGPAFSSASVALRRAPVEVTAAPAAAAGQGHDRGTVLMIVGGAAILTGIVIGNGAGYAISVGGAVIGLYGLYHYLQ